VLVNAESPEGGGEPSETEGWEIVPTHRIAKIALALGVIVIVVGVSTYAALPSIESYFGPAQTWHSFSGVFDSQGQLATESCSMQNFGPGFVGIGHTITAATIVVCTYHGASYTGYYDTDCNVVANGPAYSINGTVIPFDGCVLSVLPLNNIFSGLFTLNSKQMNDSIQIYSNQKVIANMTPSLNWKEYRCSLVTDNVTKTNGPLTCAYSGTPYLASDVVQDCNLGTPIQVNGVPVPQDSCNLQRAEAVTG